ncbi:integrase core domain-containing protein [Enterobacter ludwigii]|uniref:integrase core domain-containing protein n=1 Tax=Enterobacter ludwigii TaxID=299767 RepID=UPI0039755D15
MPSMSEQWKLLQTGCVHINGMAERFVKTMKSDYITFMPKSNVRTALINLAAAFEHYNENHPHSAQGYLSPREYRSRRITLT